MSEKLENEITSFIEEEAIQMERTMNPIPPTLRGILEKKKIEAKLEVARAMLEEGYSVDSIAKVTDLSEKELAKIKKKL